MFWLSPRQCQAFRNTVDVSVVFFCRADGEAEQGLQGSCELHHCWWQHGDVSLRFSLVQVWRQGL